MIQIICMRYWIFRKRYNTKWSKVLVLYDGRGSVKLANQQGKCPDCVRLKRQLRRRDCTVDGLSTKLPKVKEYQVHLYENKLDLWLWEAQIEYVMQTTNPAYWCMCGDGMDQQSWAIPRDPDLAAIKDLATFKRPRCVLHLMWIFDVVMIFFILDEDQAHDSSAINEMMARTLEKAVENCRARGQSIPPGLIYWVLHVNKCV